MIDTILQIAHSVLAWFGTHPAVGAVVYGWAFGILLTQLVKQFLPLSWGQKIVARVAQLLSTVSAGAFAYSMWPDSEQYQLQAAGLCGLACPHVYTRLKDALPSLLARWGWSAVVSKRITPP